MIHDGPLAVLKVIMISVVSSFTVQLQKLTATVWGGFFVNSYLLSKQEAASKMNECHHVGTKAKAKAKNTRIHTQTGVELAF